MRLLERNGAGQIRLTQNFVDDIPKYAILSHTWGGEEEEVSFMDLMNGAGKRKPGYGKIRFCVNRAWRDGLRYTWVDTCCIDKSSSAELQESINSMFRWYRDAAECYVYLADVSASSASGANAKSISGSRWFTRGWTLQELIAPPSVRFFSGDGVCLGNKKSLEQSIHDTTGIPLEALQGRILSEFTIAERMKWMEKRSTTREEDMAYSTLGIFDVSMPLNYGEGKDSAFRRLREAIRNEHRRVPGKLRISLPANYFDAAKGFYVGEAGSWCVFSRYASITDMLGPVPVVEPVGGCKTVVHCNVAPPARLATGEELRFTPDGEPEEYTRIPGVLHISQFAQYFDEQNGCYMGFVGRGSLPRLVPISDALGHIPIVEPVGGRKTAVRCAAAPPIRFASGHELRFEPDLDTYLGMANGVE
jgi:hypothetical protein